jgi:hypothetical protein
MSDQDFFQTIKKFNDDVVNDFYSKHPWKKFLSIIGLDHLRLDLIFRKFTLSQMKPLFESLIWVTLGKRDNRVGKFLGSLVYRN